MLIYNKVNMVTKSKNNSRIQPKYIKDEQGKVTEVYLDMKSYEVMLARIEEFGMLKKELLLKNKKRQ